MTKIIISLLLLFLTNSTFAKNLGLESFDSITMIFDGGDDVTLQDGVRKIVLYKNKSTEGHSADVQIVYSTWDPKYYIINESDKKNYWGYLRQQFTSIIQIEDNDLPFCDGQSRESSFGLPVTNYWFENANGTGVYVVYGSSCFSAEAQARLESVFKEFHKLLYSTVIDTKLQ